jgi:hypothetical protein
MVASGLVVIDAANAALHKSGSLYSREGSGRQGKILHCNMKTIKQLKYLRNIHAASRFFRAWKPLAIRSARPSALSRAAMVLALSALSSRNQARKPAR